RRLEGREHGVGHSGARHDIQARVGAAGVAARGEAERETEDEGAETEARAGDDHWGAACSPQFARPGACNRGPERWRCADATPAPLTQPLLPPPPPAPLPPAPCRAPP